MQNPAGQRPATPPTLKSWPKSGDPVTISRDKTGERCQVAYDQWMKIDRPQGLTKVVDIATLLLRISFQ
jgi:hypothetical protein